jgi:hypothetical protein
MSNFYDEAGYAEEPGYEAGDAYEPADDAGYEYDDSQITAAIEAAVADGFAPLIEAEQQRQADAAWWQNYEAGIAAEQEAEHAQALAWAIGQAAELVNEAAERHDVHESAANGTIHTLADEILREEQVDAIAAGDQEHLEWLHSPQAAIEAIEIAAEEARANSITRQTLYGHGSADAYPHLEEGNPDHIAWAYANREAFDRFMASGRPGSGPSIRERG